MKVYHSLEEVPEIRNLIVTQGTFDGVHPGHVKVLKKVIETAKNVRGESMLITFYPHPRLVLYPNDNSLRLLNTIAEKGDLIEKAGIDHMLVLPFTDEVARLSPLDFVRSILVEKLNIHTIIIGYDHRFGKNREGSFEDLLSFGEMFEFKVIEIPASEVDDIAISSTRIRKALLSGDLNQANALLGRPYSLRGTVIHGKQVGRKIGFPTANIKITDSYKLIPFTGVYAVWVNILGDKFMGAANIGWNPTFEDKGFSIEVFIFDFDKDVYNEPIELELVQYLRQERKFDTLHELAERIEKDVEIARRILMAG